MVGEVDVFPEWEEVSRYNTLGEGEGEGKS